MIYCFKVIFEGAACGSQSAGEVTEACPLEGLKLFPEQPFFTRHLRQLPLTTCDWGPGVF